MRVPHTISKSVLETYRCLEETVEIPEELNRTIRAEDQNWDTLRIPDLKILALQVLVENWSRNPILETLPTCDDRDTLLEMLPPDLPFNLIIKNIPYEYYWKRAAQNRWELNNPANHGNSWRQLYCECHLEEYLEKLNATYFECEKNNCDELIELLQNYIYTIKLRSLIPTKYPIKWSGDDEQDPCMAEDLTVHHIPLNFIIPRFPNLREFQISIGMIYMNDGFQWRDFEFSVEDCLNLGRGIKDCPKLKKFSLTRSNLNQPRAAALLQGVAGNNSIEEIDLSHCKLSDNDAYAIGAFLTKNKGIKVLHLVNNNIGPNGLAGIVQGLLQNNSAPLKRLNLRLNPLQDAAGTHVCALLLRHAKLEFLNISGCELGPEVGINIAEVISSGNMKMNSLSLDVSNNDFGPIAGKAFELATKSCSIIVEFDCRMCNFTKENEYLINESINRNKNKKRKDKTKTESLLRQSSSSSVTTMRKTSVTTDTKLDLQYQQPQFDYIRGINLSKQIDDMESLH